MARLIVAALLLPLLCGCPQGNSGQPAIEVERTLPDAIMASIRQPAPGQFPDAKSVVRFFLDQVAAQDVSEAARAFPIMERYRLSFDEQLAELRIVHTSRSPLPGHDFHNLMLALFDHLGEYQRLSMRLLTDDPDKIRGFPEKDAKHEIEELKRELNPARLKGLKVVSLDVQSVDERLEADFKQRPTMKALGVGAFKVVQAKLELEKRSLEVTFIVGQLGDNWRILSMAFDR